MRTKPSDHKLRKVIRSIAKYRAKELEKYGLNDPRSIHLIAKDLYRVSLGLVAFDCDGNPSFDLPLKAGNTSSSDSFVRYVKRWTPTIIKVLTIEIPSLQEPAPPSKPGIPKEQALEIARKFVLESFEFSISDKIPDGLYVCPEYKECWCICCSHRIPRAVGGSYYIGISKQTGEVVFSGIVGE